MRVICLVLASTVWLGAAFAPSHDGRMRATVPHNSASRSTNLYASKNVAVFGGGFGGLYTALAIARDAKLRGDSVDVTLVDDSDSFVFLPLLYDLTVGTASEAEVCPKYADLLEGTGIQHLRSTLESLESDQCATIKNGADESTTLLDFSACVVSVGASPKAILSSVSGASEYAQPFYTQPDAKMTQELLTKLEKDDGTQRRIAIVGGGFGGVELAAAVKRRIPKAAVSLLSRGSPMAGTRAEPLVNQALIKLGVIIEDCSVEEIKPAATDEEEKGTEQLTVTRRNTEGNVIEDDYPWDAVLWTAGSGPAYPVAEGLDLLQKSDTGRLGTDGALRCVWGKDSNKLNKPNIWALGDCAEVIATNGQPAIPRTAQAAMQQADAVASNLLAQLDASTTGRIAMEKDFVYQDLGSMLMLGGPNAALMAPRQGPFDALFAPALDTMGQVLGAADQVISAVSKSSPIADKFSPEILGLSLGSHGLGVDSSTAPGTLAGTLTGAARRAVYAARMPTNKQRAVSAFSAAISTAAALAKEVEERNK